MKRVAALFFPVFSLFAQPTVYLRTPGVPGFVITGASNTTPVVVQTSTAHNLSIGDTVTLWGVMASVSGSCVSSAANGLRVVKAVVDATHFNVTDQGGTDIAANGAWCDGSNPPNYGGGAMAGGKVSAYTPVAQPRGWLDGPTGPVTRKLAMGTNNGLVSLIVSGNVATATTSYTHGISVGDKVGVWGSGVSALNHTGLPYTVTAATSTTFTFTTSGVSNGTYSNSNNTCGPGANQDCLRISQLAWTGNIFWDAMVNRDLNSWESGVSYKHHWDGGGFYGSNLIAQNWGLAALKALVDPSDTAMINVAKYCVTHIERTSGVNWSQYEAAPEGGNYDLNDFASYIVYGGSLCYMAARPYLTTGEKQTFADKMYNDVDSLNATPCNKAHTQPALETLASGTAQSGSTTTITLAAGDTAADGFYVNNVIRATVGGNPSFGLVTAYTSGTKIATVASWTAGAPSNGTAYTMLATATIASTAGAATTTVTGYNSRFTADFQVGDAIMAINNPWASAFFPQTAESYITAIASDTSMTVINSSGVTISTTTPHAVWIMHQWQAGDCGLQWAQNHWGGALGASPILYPPNGGNLATVHMDGQVLQTPAIGGNNGYTRTAAWTELNFVLADDDPRAIPYLAQSESQFWDWYMRLSWNYTTGLEHSGSYYSFGREQNDGTRGVWAIAQSVPALASGMDLTGNWVSQVPMMQMYATYPDRRWDGSHFSPWPTRWGSSTAINAINGSYQSGSWQTQPSYIWMRDDIRSKYALSFMSTLCCVFHGTDLNPWADIWDQGSAQFGLLAVDPRLKSSDYTVQPNQYALIKSSSATACANTGWPCPSTTRADAVVSHTGWGSLGSPNLRATQVYFGARAFVGDHDAPEMGTIRVYKVGHLLNSDGNPPGNALEQGDTSATDTVPKLGGLTSSQAMNGPPQNITPAASNITRWASASHGAWDSSYGDASSRYSYAMADFAAAYKSPPNRVQRHMIHFKKPGTEEIVVQFDDIDIANAPTQVEAHIHYPQNGEKNIDGYDEGDTTCPGAGGCSSLNTSRLIQSLEDGNSDGHDPVRQYGVVSQILSPGTIFVRDDGSSYSGGNGHTHRISLCGGAACGATVSRFEALAVHKIAAGLNDTSLTAKTLGSDPNWAAIETTDADGSGGKVAVIARNGKTPFNLNVQTDHAGTAQYLVAGLQARFVYRVYRNDDGTDVTSGTVTDGDNSLYFEAPAGSYSIFPEGLKNLFLRPTLPRAQAGTPFEYAFPPAGSAPAFAWRVSSGRLAPGLNLSTAGVLSGTATQSGSFTFTVTAEATGNTAVSKSTPMTLQVASPALNLNVRAITTSQVVVAYGQRGLDAAQTCGVTLSTQSDFGTISESFTDEGGGGIRWHVFGTSSPLRPSQTYYAQADCGTSFSPVLMTFETPAAGEQRAATVRVSVAPAHGATAVEVQYGNTPQLGSTAQSACSGGCTVELPAMTDTLLYTRRVYRNTASQVVAASSIGVTAVSR